MGEEPFGSELLFTSQSPRSCRTPAAQGNSKQTQRTPFASWWVGEAGDVSLPFLVLIMIKHFGLMESHGDPEPLGLSSLSLGGRQRVAALV